MHASVLKWVRAWLLSPDAIFAPFLDIPPQLVTTSLGVIHLLYFWVTMLSIRKNYWYFWQNMAGVKA